MLNRKITNAMALTLALGALSATAAFAADATNPPADDPQDSQINAVKVEEAHVANWKTDENGDQYFEMENGEKVYYDQTMTDSTEALTMTDANIDYTITVSGDWKDGSKTPDLKTDENGGQYFESENGERVYFAQVADSSVNVVLKQEGN